jgi:hypothetical protein
MLHRRSHALPLALRRLARALAAPLVAVLFALAGLAAPARAADPTQGPGGPILVVTSSASTYATYYAEILRTEGLDEFAVADIATLTPAVLANVDVLLLGKMPVTAAQASMLSSWVNAGGHLIAFAPDPALASLLGLAPSGSTLTGGYVAVDTSRAPGNGITAQTMQFHGTAVLASASGARVLATLYLDAATSTGLPALTLNSYGAGQAAAFAYDLAESVIDTRQGNPAWAAQERDGTPPIRSNDKFYGASASDPQPDWVDLSRVAIPQADEQQRLLANLVTLIAARPMPRFWYFPNGKKAAIVMTGDDHGNGGTGPRFDQFAAASAAGCVVANWECIRGTSYIYASTPLTDTQAAQYNAAGFEIGLHVNTGCADFTASSLASTYATQLAAWKAAYPSLPAPVTQRHHCVVWSDWITGAQVESSNGMRLDTSYYFWPASWVDDTPGVFTGSAMPMRFAGLDGRIADVYQATSQMTDESGQSYPFTVDTLLDRATGPLGYYGAYVINAHTDYADSNAATTTIASAQAHGVPVVSARQMLTWLDARNASSFAASSWAGGSLAFNVVHDPAANGLQGMLPLRAAGGALLAQLRRAGSAVTTTVATVKGVEYALFSADAGSYVATYAADTTAPTVVSTLPAAGAGAQSVTIQPSAAFSEALDPSTVGTASVDLRDSAGALVAAGVAWNASTRSAILSPAAPLKASATYTVTVHGGAADPRVKDPAGNALAANVSWSFTTASAPVGCPCDVWPNAPTPTIVTVSDPNPVELGVRFTSDVAGTVTGIRFYKGPSNTGVHVGDLWSNAGALLGRATFANESASGWQQVNFATPVTIAANTVYVASYFAPNGEYSADIGFFANAGVDAPPLHLLKDGVAGGNGLYGYGSSPSFPASTYHSNNYWVEPLFTPASSTGPDTTPPTVVATTPAGAAGSEGTPSPITATFSEPIDPATLTTATMLVATAAGAPIAGTVSYDPTQAMATFNPSAALPASTTLKATVVGGTTDPRVKDLAGNALAASVSWSFLTAPLSGACAAPANATVAENCLTGNPSTEWDVTGTGDATIQGYATQISVNRGETVGFKVDTDAAAWRMDIYRMGWYGGMGARKVATVTPSATLPQVQPDCLSDTTTGLVDCGNWALSASWSVPATAASGIYFGRLVRTDTGGASHVFFVVRDDARHSALLFQTSDTTWQAYNQYGGNSLYVGAPAGRAYKVSYNRPFTTRGVAGGQDWVFNAEYPMVRWLESNGYDVAYQSGVDTDRNAALLLGHAAFLSVGHDEYWSGGQRANVEAARGAGVSLAFFSGNEIFWKTRWEPSIDGSATAYRTLVCYKETSANAKIDPTPTWTGTWRDPRFSPPADGNRPENALSGTLFMNNDTGVPYSITVPADDGKMRFWRGTSVAAQAAGGVATLPVGTLGYEWDIDSDNGARPPGLQRLSTTTITSGGVLQDYGTNYGPGTLTHSMTFYRHASGARVFSAGSIQWAWGLDSHHDRGNAAADPRMQQASVNVLADMGVQPATLQPGLVAATASADTTPPTSVITSPAAGAAETSGNPVTITGTATDAGGGVVGGVEVSTDGGTTWHAASGRASWSYVWTPGAPGSAVLRSRAVDDSGNLESPAAGVSVTIAGRSCPCSVWAPTAAPVLGSVNDGLAVNLGMRWRSDVAGKVTALRFWKGSGNTGTHVGTLWSAAGTMLGRVTFSGETASGWQQATLATPVAIAANTVYVVSYFAPAGHYAGDNNGFLGGGVDNPPLHALQDGAAGANGLYAYASSSTFPTQSYASSNYWVDVVFSPTP